MLTHFDAAYGAASAPLGRTGIANVKEVGYTVILLALLTVAAPAHATRNVSSPVITENQYSYELRLGIERDDTASQGGRVRQQHFLEYDFTDWYAMRLTGRWSRPQDEPNDFTSFDWEHHFQLVEERDHGWDGGMRFIYQFADNDGVADDISVVFLAQKKIASMQYRANASLDHEVGADSRSGLGVNLAFQAMHKVNDQFSAGIEMFNDIGKLRDMSGLNDLPHQAGPVLLLTVMPGTVIETGYLLGLSDPASDGLFKLFVKGTF